MPSTHAAEYCVILKPANQDNTGGLLLEKRKQDDERGLAE